VRRGALQVFDRYLVEIVGALDQVLSTARSTWETFTGFAVRV
jgi:hypothetical protein